MPLTTRGLHHVTAIARDLATNISFYTAVLGLRLVKRTINFDDRRSQHVYYGDRTGRPGTLLTFFVGLDPVPMSANCSRVSCVRFGVPPGSMDYWRDHLSAHAIPSRVVDTSRGSDGSQGLSFADPDGLPLQLASSLTDSVPAVARLDSQATVDHAIRGLESIELSVMDPAPSTLFLEQRLGLRPLPPEGDRRRFEAATPGRARHVDLRVVTHLSAAPLVAGNVHHVAFRAADAEEQRAWREQLLAAGADVTPVKDRKYFQSIYFPEPGGARFEIATDGPGFTIDESDDHLGQQLQLPDHLD